jgi:hypothetical protein
MSVSHFLLNYYPIFFVWLTGITSLVLFRRSWSFPFRFIAAFFIFYLAAETAGSIMAGIYKINNHFYYNILFNIRFIVISIFFYWWLSGRFSKKMIIGFLFLFPLFVLINAFRFQGFFTLQTYSYALGGCFIIVLSILYFWQLYNSEETYSIFNDPVFWFSLSWLFYFIVTVPFFGMLNYFVNNSPEFALKYYLLVIDVMDCVENILLTIGLLCLRTRTK